MFLVLVLDKLFWVNNDILLPYPGYNLFEKLKLSLSPYEIYSWIKKLHFLSNLGILIKFVSY